MGLNIVDETRTKASFSSSIEGANSVVSNIAYDKQEICANITCFARIKGHSFTFVNSLKFRSILYIIFPTVCLCALTLYPATARLRCCDRYIRRHRLLAVKSKGTCGEAGGKGRNSWQRTQSVSPWSRVTVAGTLHVQASGAGSTSSFRNRIIITTHSLQG